MRLSRSETNNTWLLSLRRQDAVSWLANDNPQTRFLATCYSSLSKVRPARH